MKKNEFKIGSAIVRIVMADITDMSTDAIVNAANSSLRSGGGVDGAIHRKGGPKIREECMQVRTIEWPDGLPKGKSVITSGGNLKAKNVIHTVGPVWHGGGQEEPRFLTEAYLNSLKLAASRKLKSVAFPSISTGAYGYPVSEASRLALKVVKTFLENTESIDEVVFVLFSEPDLAVYLQAAREILS